MRTRNEPPTPEQRKKIFKEAFNLNSHIHIKDLCQITDLAQNTIEGYLYEKNRYPSMWLLQIITWMILYSRGTIPFELDRITQRYQARCRLWGKGRKQNLTTKKIGDKKHHRRTYILDGDIVTNKGLAERFGYTEAGMRCRLKNEGVRPGDDVSCVDLARRKRRSNEIANG